MATILDRVALDSVCGNGVLNHTRFAEFITDFALRTMKAPVCVINPVIECDTSLMEPILFSFLS